MPTKADYAVINIGCKELGIDKHTLLSDRYGVASSKDLTADQMRDLRKHLRANGFRPSRPTTVKNGRKSTRRKDDNFIEIKPGPYAKMQRKILAMWAELGYDVAKLHARCKRQFGVERFEWVQDYHDLHVLITDLEARR